jgi:hypothetical protein
MGVPTAVPAMGTAQVPLTLAVAELQSIGADE